MKADIDQKFYGGRRVRSSGSLSKSLSMALASAKSAVANEPNRNSVNDLKYCCLSEFHGTKKFSRT